MKRKHDLLKEKSKTRDAVGQISSWCLLIALHQRFGVGADRMERIAGDAEKLQKEIAAIIDEHGTAAGIAEMQRRLDGICLTEMRVPLKMSSRSGTKSTPPKPEKKYSCRNFRTHFCKMTRFRFARNALTKTTSQL